jgi:hypothetical protein
MLRFALSRALTAADFRTAALANWSITFAELADLWGLPATPDGLKDAREFALAAAAELAGAYATLPPKRKGDAHGGLFPYLRRAVPTKDGGLEIGFNPDFLAELSGGQWTLTDARAVGKLGEQKRGAYAIAAAMERAYYMDAKRVTGANGRLSVAYLLDIGGYKTRDELGTHRNAWRDRVKGRLERDLDTLTEQPRALLKRWWYCRPNETLPLTAEAVAGLAWGGWYALCVAYEMDAPLPLAERDRIEAAKQKRDTAKANAKKARASKAQKRIAKAKAKAAPPTPPEFAQRPIGAPTPSPQAHPTATDAPPLEEERRYLSAKEMHAGLAQVRAHLIEAGLVPRRAPAPEPTTPLEEKYKGIEEARRRLAELPDKIARYRGLMADATDPKQRDAYAVLIAALERQQAEAQATIDAL